MEAASHDLFQGADPTRCSQPHHAVETYAQHTSATCGCGLVQSRGHQVEVHTGK